MASLFSCIFANVWLAAVVRDKSRGAAAKLFDDRVASVVKWTQRTHETGSSAARPIGGKRRYLLAGLLARLGRTKRTHATLENRDLRLGQEARREGA
jgi:transposase